MTGTGEDEVAYEVRLSNNALYVHLNITSETAAQKVEKVLELLQSFPELGHVYEPLYTAAQTPFTMRVIYAGTYGIYYDIDDAAQIVNIDFIEDQRRDPESRFTNVIDFYAPR